VQAHASDARAALPLDEGEIVGADAVAEPQDALPGAPSHRSAPDQRGRVQRSEQRLLVAEGISLRWIGVGPEPPALEEPGETSCHTAGDAFDLVVVRRRERPKGYGAISS
jgi:hypothetical protein